MKVLNIDEFLKEKSVEVQLGGKKFIVKDLPLELQKMMRQVGKDEEGTDEVTTRDVVMKILGCTEKDLEGYGMAAFAAIINQVTENLFQTSSQKKA